MKRLLALGAVVVAALTLGLAGVASADINAVTPSTNASNTINGWAHVDQLSKGLRTTGLQFTSTRSFYSCFEYRTDGDTSQVLPENGGANYNTQVTDGLYRYVCENNSTDTLTVDAKRYVVVRMVFGAESDERFDWTRFDVDPCQATGFVRDGIDLTAAQIGGSVTGTLDASSCNIGVYYAPGNGGSVSGADIYGANYFGVVANGVSVDVTDSSIHDIGESPFNGSQHGVGVFYSEATGSVSGNSISDYQKNGVVVSGSGAAVTVSDNTVEGLGPVSFIAQNGIQISYRATGLVTGNSVSGNWYTPATWTACGLLFYQAGGVKQKANTLFANQTNLCNAGRGGGKYNP